jgi:O-antigen ligase
VAVAGVAVGLTYSRAGLLALAGLLVPVALALRSPRTRGAALALMAAAVIGFGATALVASSGWVGRAEEASARTNLDRGRGELADQAFALIRRHPVLGVGTGRYVLAVEADREVAARSTRLLQPVHAVPLLLVAEAGIPGLLAVLALGIAVLRAVVRGGLAGWALLLAYLPFLVLDHFPATFPQGLVVTAGWLGALAVVGARDSPREEVEADARSASSESPPIPPDLARPADR